MESRHTGRLGRCGRWRGSLSSLPATLTISTSSRPRERCCHRYALLPRLVASLQGRSVPGLGTAPWCGRRRLRYVDRLEQIPTLVDHCKSERRRIMITRTVMAPLSVKGSRQVSLATVMGSGDDLVEPGGRWKSCVEQDSLA